MDYKNLSKKDKLNLLQYIKGVYALSGIDHYGEIKNAPNESPKAEFVLISNVLGVDFKEFYQKSPINKDVEKNDKVKGYLIDLGYTYGACFIGDAITDILYQCIEKEEDLFFALDRFEKDARLVYDFYNKLHNGEEKAVEYREVGVLNGKTVYERVEK